MEQVTMTIPENVAAAIRGDGVETLEHRMLELAAIQAYESELISSGLMTTV